MLVQVYEAVAELDGLAANSIWSDVIPVQQLHALSKAGYTSVHLLMVADKRDLEQAGVSLAIAGVLRKLQITGTPSDLEVERQPYLKHLECCVHSFYLVAHEASMIQARFSVSRR
jgi:hypothetical protein